MHRISRRSFAKSALAPVAGAFALPALARAVQEHSSVYTRPKLKITDIRTAEVMVHGLQTHVRVYTDQGLIRPRRIYGRGEWNHRADADVRPLSHRERSLKCGRAVGTGPNCRHLCRCAGRPVHHSPDWARDALWDLAGKALNLPVYQLLGGKFRDRIRMYCDSDMDDPLGSEAEQKLTWIQSAGFTAMKIDLDEAKDPARFDAVNWTASNGEIDRMVSWVKHTRESIPKEMDLACDMHGRYDAPTGKRVAIAVEPYRLLWLEEPVPPDDIDAMADIRHATKTPICCGENLYMRWGFRELLDKQAADIIMPDICRR